MLSPSVSNAKTNRLDVCHQLKPVRIALSLVQVAWTNEEGGTEPLLILYSQKSKRLAFSSVEKSGKKKKKATFVPETSVPFQKKVYFNFP